VAGKDVRTRKYREIAVTSRIDFLCGNTFMAQM
jgi:hypothetical protein